ncbi:MAG: M28 family peptidase [Candidatus Poribacteria bacterium]|nr:M28 family peptidase [Candidatus Poribacteria bacterium]
MSWRSSWYRLPLVWLMFLIVFGCSDEEVANAQMLPRMDADLAFAHLTAQTDFGFRVPGTQAHVKTRDYLVKTLKEHTKQVELQPFTERLEGRDVQMWNIVATFGDASKKGIVLCAHWDTRPTADQEVDPAKRKQPISGANDGASGVAVLLEMARQFELFPPKMTVTIVLFDGEDYGPGTDKMFLGSRYYARNPLPQAPLYAILLDMVGDADLTIPIEPLSWNAARPVVEGVWNAADAIGARAFVRIMGRPIHDDHVSLIDQGIPAIDIIDFDYPHWHTLGDTPDKCSPESLASVGNVLLRFLYTLKP